MRSDVRAASRSPRDRATSPRTRWTRADRRDVTVRLGDLERPPGGRVGQVEVSRRHRDERALDQRVDQHGPAGTVVGARRVDGRVEMAGGSRGVAAPGVDPAEPELDRRQAGLVRDCGRRLEGADRPGVVALRRADLPQRRLDADDVGVAERQRRLEMRAGLVQRVHLAGPQPGVAERLGGLGVAPGRALVDGHLDEPARVVAAVGIRPKQVGDAPVEQPPPDEADPLVGRLAEPRVGEVEGQVRARGQLPDEAAPDELLEGADRLVLGPPARGPGRGRSRTSGR